MKKYLLSFVIMLGLSISGVASASLWDYYNGNLPTITERAKVYPGTDQYVGSYEQNIALESFLRGETLGGTRATSPVAGATYNLAGSGLTSSATSIVLQKLTIPQTGYELLDADFSDIFYITLEPGSTKRQEIVSCTTVSQGAGTTATLSGCTRGLLPFYPFTASSTFQFTHAGGTSVIFSDPPQLFEQYASINSTSTISAIWKFGVYPESNQAIGVFPTTSRQFATKEYVDDVGAGGFTSSNVGKGLQALGTVPEKVAFYPAPTSTSGLGFLGSQVIIVTSSANGIIANADGLAISTSTALTWSGTQTFGNTVSTNSSSTSFYSETLKTDTFLVSDVDVGAVFDGSDADSFHNHPLKDTFVSSTSQILTITNNSSLFSIVTTTISGGTLDVDKCVFAETNMTDFDNTSGASTGLTMTLVYGATTIATITSEDLNHSNYFGKLTARLCGNGTTSKQFGELSLVLYNDASPELLNTNSNSSLETVFGTATVNSTIDQSFRLTSKWGNQSASTNVVWTNAYVYKTAY